MNLRNETKIPEKPSKTKAPISTREEKVMHPKLKSDRLRRQHRRATHRYRLRNPTHKAKTGHNFRRNTAYAPQHQVCVVCGRNR